MRISDWSSDVCSSDLPSDTNAVRIALTSQGVALAGSTHRLLSAYECINAYLNLHFPKSEQLQSFFDYLGNNVQFIQISAEVGQALKMFETINERGVSLNAMDLQIGRASCRERVCQYG